MTCRAIAAQRADGASARASAQAMVSQLALAVPLVSAKRTACLTDGSSVFYRRTRQRISVGPRQVMMFGTPWLDATLRHTNPVDALAAIGKLISPLWFTRSSASNASRASATAASAAITAGARSSERERQDAEMTAVEPKKRKAESAKPDARAKDATWSSSKRPKVVSSSRRPPAQKKLSLADLFS